VVPNTASAIAGGYRATLASSGTLTVATADPTNPRIDLVCANVVDNGNNTSSGEVQIITGTPAASPSAPSAPANSVSLAQVTVPANATSITSGDIADVRTFTAAAGGIPIAGKTGATALAAGYNGLMAYDPASGSFYHMSASGAKQAHVLPFAPVHTLIPASTLIGANSVGTLESATVTTDGNTDLKVTVRVDEIEQVSGSSTGFKLLLVAVYVDSTVIGNYEVGVNLQGSGQNANGFEIMAFTSSAAGNTPSAGSHTIAVKAGFSGLSGNVFETTSPGTSTSFLRVEPVGL
jgi:hypothetical protein